MCFVLLCTCTNKLFNVETKVLKAQQVLRISNSRVKGYDKVRIFDYIDRSIDQFKRMIGFIILRPTL